MALVGAAMVSVDSDSHDEENTRCKNTLRVLNGEAVVSFVNAFSATLCKVQTSSTFKMQNCQQTITDAGEFEVISFDCSIFIIR